MILSAICRVIKKALPVTPVDRTGSRFLSHNPFCGYGIKVVLEVFLLHNQSPGYDMESVLNMGQRCIDFFISQHV